MKELKGFSINGHTITLLLDNVCSIPFFTVRVDGKGTFAGKSRIDAVNALDIACAQASKEVTHG